MSIVWRHAEEIFATARQNPREDCQMAILVGPRGTIHIAGSDGWNIESLRLHHGAAAAYQVTRRYGRVRVDARSSEGTCVFEGFGGPHALQCLPEWPRYQIVPGPLELSAG